MIGDPKPYHVDEPKAAYDGSELAIQTLFRSRCRIYCPAVRLVAVPNGTFIKSRAGRNKAKQEGLAAGFPDMLAYWPNDVAFIEFKAKRGTLKPNQKERLRDLTNCFFNVGVFRHPDTAIRFLHQCGAPFMAAPPGEPK